MTNHVLVHVLHSLVVLTILLGLERSELMSGCICELSDYGDYQESF